MDAVLQFRPRQVLETEDLACTWVENALGRHDWINNWQAYKQKNPDYVHKIQEFFEQQGNTIDAQAVAHHIELMTTSRPGRWQ